MDVDGFASGWRAVLLLIVFALVTCTALAEEGVLVLVVMDTEQHPFANVRVGTAGDAGSPQFTDQNGKARLKLAPNTKPAAWVTLQLLGAPNGLDLAFISPYDGRIRVPPFDNEQDNYDPVILAKHSDKATLESGSGMLAIHANVTHAVATAKKKPTHTPASRNRSPAKDFGVARLQTISFRSGVQASSDSPMIPADDAQQKALAAVAESFGFSVPEIQAAMDRWGGSDLVWTTAELTSLLDDGGTDPFSAVRAPAGNITFGTGSWSLRECTLQPLLLKFQEADPERFAAIMGLDTKWLTKTMHLPCKDSFTIASERLLGGPNTLDRTWRSRFNRLGNEPTFQHVQVEQLATLMNAAQSSAAQLGLPSSQAAVFCHDVMVQLGSAATKEGNTSFLQDVAAFQKEIGRKPDEQERLLMLANRMIQREKQQGPSPETSEAFVARANLLSRGSGTVAERYYDLADLGIGLTSTQTGVEIPLVNDPVVHKRLEDRWIPGMLAFSPGQCDPAGEKQLVKLINQERATHGLQPLTVDQRLTQAARKHTELVAGHKTLSHQFDGEPAMGRRFADENLPSDRQAENLGLSRDAPSAEAELMRSADHRANILSPAYNAVGVCVIRSGGQVYVTEDFAHQLTEYSGPEVDAVLQRAVESYATAHGISALVRKPQPQLQHMACDMARDDSLQNQSAGELPGVHETVAWTTAAPEELPSSATEMLSHPISGYSLGACFAPSASQPGGVYWVLMVGY